MPNAIFCVLLTKCRWRALPQDLRLKSTVWGYSSSWGWDGAPERPHHALYVAAR